MTRGTRTMQDRLYDKGYRFYESCISADEATSKAEELRKIGYRATALECPTRIKGYYDYCVFAKMIANA